MENKFLAKLEARDYSKRARTIGILFAILLVLSLAAAIYVGVNRTQLYAGSTNTHTSVTAGTALQHDRTIDHNQVLAHGGDIGHNQVLAHDGDLGHDYERDYDYDRGHDFELDDFFLRGGLNAFPGWFIGGGIALAIAWAALGIFYWITVAEWMYKMARKHNLNTALWPILGLVFNVLAAALLLIVICRPADREPLHFTFPHFGKKKATTAAPTDAPTEFTDADPTPTDKA